jgi:hypothetical protein
MSEFEQVWQEDDATCGHDGHEGCNAAYKRLAGKEFKKEEAVEMKAYSDGTEYFMPNGFVVFRSFPGNSTISKRKT